MLSVKLYGSLSMYVAEWFIECNIFLTESDIGKRRKVRDGRV